MAQIDEDGLPRPELIAQRADPQSLALHRQTERRHYSTIHRRNLHRINTRTLHKYCTKYAMKAGDVLQRNRDEGGGVLNKEDWMILLAADNPQFDPTTPIRVLIVAAYPMARAGLAALLGGVPDIAVAGQTAGGAGLAMLIEQTMPTILLIDQPGDDEEALDRLAAILAGGTNLIALVLGDDQTAETLSASLGAGVRGYLPRESSGGELIAAVRAVAAGLLVLDPTAAAELLDRATERPRPPLNTAPGEALTPRELEVLQALAAGQTNRAIARQLSVSENTIKFHVSSILTKLSAASRAEAVALAARRGLLLL
jgi:DNA-binding NarL/FixJ family response regulator